MHACNALPCHTKQQRRLAPEGSAEAVQAEGVDEALNNILHEPDFLEVIGHKTETQGVTGKFSIHPTPRLVATKYFHLAAKCPPEITVLRSFSNVWSLVHVSRCLLSLLPCIA
jgi:hypothetical protein